VPGGRPPRAAPRRSSRARGPPRRGAGRGARRWPAALPGRPAAPPAWGRRNETRERIGLAVAQRRGDPYSIAQHARTARGTGLGLDEVSRARAFRSADPKQAALLAFLEALLATDGRPAQHLAEEAREQGWTDEELLEAVAHLALNEFQSLIANAAALPQDQADPSVLPEVA
jgi:alkylhydroperoxidase family enzyme